MEMARRAKEKTETETKTNARAQATVKAATGNGNLYTQNISTVKEHQQDEKFVCSAAKSAKIQNTKKKIKISQYQRKRDHLKVLINLYAKLILCISEINETILKIFRTKSKINFNYLCNYSSKCTINLKQKLQEIAQAQYLKAFSLEFQIVRDSLTKFHYCKGKNLRNIYYVKLTIRHFVGICLKRLISLKRLQQIPENHNKIDESLHSTHNKIKACNFGYSKENLKLLNEQDLQLRKVYILSFKHDKFKESLKASLNFKEKKFKAIQCGAKKCNRKNPKRWYRLRKPQTKFINRSFNEKCCQLSPVHLDFKLQQFFSSFVAEFGQFHLYQNVYEHETKAIASLQLQSSKEALLLYYSSKKCGQLVDIFKHNNRVGVTNIKIKLFSPLLWFQRSQHKAGEYEIVVHLSVEYKGSVQDCKKIFCHDLKLPEIYNKSSQNSNQLEFFRFKFTFGIQMLDHYGTSIKEQFSKKNCYLANSTVNEISELLHQKYVQVYKQRFEREISFQAKWQKQPTLNRRSEIRQLLIYLSAICGQQNKQINILTEDLFTHSERFHFKNETAKELQKVIEIFGKKYLQSTIQHRIAFEKNITKTLQIATANRSRQRIDCKLLSFEFSQNIPSIIHYPLTKSPGFKQNMKMLGTKFENAFTNSGFISIAHANNENCDNTSDKRPKFHQKLCIENGLRKQFSFSFINGQMEDEMKLAYNTNIARQFQIFQDDNNDSYQLESKQQKIPKECQRTSARILYSILFYYFCSCYWWHIYGFPLVFVHIFKYLKDATVNVLTRRFKITTIATSVYYDYGNIKAACDGKLNTPIIVADYKANQENILKRQTIHTTASSTSAAYSSSCCSTASLTNSSAYCKSLKNLIVTQQQILQPCASYCCCQQHHRDHHHHYHHHYHHHQQRYYCQCNGPNQQTIQQRQQQLQLPQQYNKFISTIHLQLPSLLAFSRTLIILILLSSLWHTSEGFHGSSVKLSTNTVRTKYGVVRGIVVRSSPSLVEAYLGVPYASPPVGSLRFMPPITPSTWKNVRNADRFSPVCPQNVPIPPNGPEALLEVPRARLAQLRRLLPLLSNQSEDCLYLNIYVPLENHRHRRFTTNSEESNDAPKLPTILFIHGESYEWNSGNPYDGSELAAHGNVIVVTINFRLGILGFLKTGGKESAQGNFGLMDLVAGLHWLKENLPAFGGDPQQITLLGHGTGAALANILVVSPVASDLIQHTVMVSGSALSPWAIQRNPLFVKRRVAEQTGCHGDMLYYDLAPCLRTKTITELLAVKIDHPRFLVGFAPFIDGTVISPNTDSIGKLSLPLGSAIVSTSGIEYANFPKRNLIFCLTSVESHLDLSAQDLEFGFNETRRDRILRTYVRNNFHYHLNEIFAVLKNEYTEWDKAIRSPLSSRDATLQFLSDGHTASSLIKLGYMHSLRGGKGYFLHFKHRTVEEEYPQRTGSVRGEDVPFWLGLPISPLFPHNYTTQEKQISRLMLRYLANFAKTGNPNQSSLSPPLPSLSSLIGSPSSSSYSSSSSSSSSQTADSSSEKIKRSSHNIENATSSSSSGPNKSSHIIEDVATAAAREALNLAVLYNQRRTKRTYYKRHSRSNDDHSGSASSEVNYFSNTNSNSNNNNNNDNKLDSKELPFWDAYDVVNQLYMELGNKAEIQSHYRGHKLSMWLNLIPQLHRHANMNDQSMRHHQFQDDLNNLNLYEGIVRAQIQTKPDDDDETLILPKGRPTTPPPVQETNSTQKPQGTTTDCGVDGAMFVAEMTTQPPADNRSLVLDSREKEMATASTGLIGNLEVLRRLSGKQFQSYTTALVATVAVGCFLLILNILIFAGIYHQREKRARDAKTKEELQDNDTSKNSSMLKLNALGSETGSFSDTAAGVSGKTTVVFGEYNCYDEKSLQTKDPKLIVELPPAQLVDANWAGCSTSTLDLLKTKHHTPLETTYTLGNVVPINTESHTDHLMAINNLEMATYSPLPMTSGLIMDPSFAATSSSSGLLSKRGSFVGSTGQLNQYDFASVQSSDQMSFKDIENAVKASAAMNDGITQDDDIPEPPPPPRSFQSMQQQQLQHAATNIPTTTSGSGGGGILRQAGTASTSQAGGGKKRVHIQEISV